MAPILAPVEAALPASAMPTPPSGGFGCPEYRTSG